MLSKKVATFYSKPEKKRTCIEGQVASFFQKYFSTNSTFVVPFCLFLVKRAQQLRNGRI